jgi:hypothetical protein
MFKAVKAAIGWKKKTKKKANDLGAVTSTKEPSIDGSESSWQVSVSGNEVVVKFTPTCTVCNTVDELDVPSDDIASFQYECSLCSTVQMFRPNPATKNSSTVSPDPPQQEKKPNALNDSAKNATSSTNSHKIGLVLNIYYLLPPFLYLSRDLLSCAVSQVVRSCGRIEANNRDIRRLFRR